MGYLSEMPNSPSQRFPAVEPQNDGWPSPQSPRAATPGYRPPTPYHARAPEGPPPQAGHGGLLNVPEPRSPAAPRSHHSFHDDNDDSATLAPSDSFSHVSARRSNAGHRPQNLAHMGQRGPSGSVPVGYYTATLYASPVTPAVNAPLATSPVQPAPFAAAYAGSVVNQGASEPVPAWVVTSPMAPSPQQMTHAAAGYPPMMTAVQPFVGTMTPTGGHQIGPGTAAQHSGMALLSPAQAGNPYRVRASSMTHTRHGETTHIYSVEMRYRH